MTNTKANSIGLSIMIIIAIIILLFTSSCGTTRLTDEQLFHRNNVQHEIDKLWTDYKYQSDSLWIEYYKK